MNFTRLDAQTVQWDYLDRLDDRTIFQTRQWIHFLAETQNGDPVIAELRSRGVTIGHFTGLMIRRFGFRILGSPFPGWTTPYMGFNLLSDVPKSKVLEALAEFAFDDLGCVHVEVADRCFSAEDGARAGFAWVTNDDFETDLTRSEEELFKAMSKSCRWSIRKAANCGVQIEEATGEQFVDDYFEQLKDVFAKQNLVPTYGRRRVQKLIDCLLPTGHLLLLRALDADGRCIATGIYPAFNKVAEFWGNGSFRWGQHLQPNEYLHWHAMRYWRDRGIQIFDWGGGGKYKAKYATRPTSLAWFRKSRFPLIERLRHEAERAFSVRQRLLGMLHTAGRTENSRP